jgi:hypothetical protein
MEPANENATKMSWDLPSTSFLSAHPVGDGNDAPKREMFPQDTAKNQTPSQARQSAMAQMEAESNRALADLKAGVRVSQFISTVKKVADFKMNEKDQEVALFMEKLSELCQKVTKAESRVLFMEESVSDKISHTLTLIHQRWNKMSTAPWKALVLRASSDLLETWVNAPNRLAGFYSYCYEITDLTFPRCSGLYMKLFKAGSIKELKARVWHKAAEISVADMVEENAKNLRVLFEKVAPSKVNASCYQNPKNI